MTRPGNALIGFGLAVTLLRDAVVSRQGRDRARSGGTAHAPRAALSRRCGDRRDQTLDAYLAESFLLSSFLQFHHVHTPMLVLFYLVLGAALLTWAADNHPSNNVAKDHPDDMTAVWEQSLFLLPILRETALQLAGSKYKLLPPTGLPHGYLQDDEHLLFVNLGQQYDIRQGSLVVPRLASYNTYIPFVDVSEDGRTPFQVLMQSYTDSALALLGVLSYDSLEVANFDPAKDAYKRIGTDQIAAAVTQDKLAPLKRGLLGSVLGIDLTDQRFQYLTTRVNVSTLPAQTFVDVANQPYLHSLTHLVPKCGLAHVLFNQTYSAPFFSRGDVQVFPPTLPASRTYSDVYAYTGIAAYIQKAGLGDDCKSFSLPADE